MDGLVLSTCRPQRLLVVARHGQELYRSRGFLQGMALAGHELLLAWLDGDVGDVPAVGRQARIRPHLARSPRTLYRQVATTPVSAWRGDRTTLLGASRLDPDLQRAIGRADALVAIGDEARRVADDIATDRCPVVPHSDLRGWASLPRTWRQLQARVRADRLTVTYALNLAQRARIVGGVPDGAQDDLAALLGVLVRIGGYAAAEQLLPYLDLEVTDPVECARRRGLAAAVRTLCQGREATDLRGAATGLVRAADALLATSAGGTGEVGRAADLAALALRLLFHPELHSDGLSSPLVETPDQFLADWRASQVGRTLARSTTRPGAPEADASAARATPPAAGARRPRVVVVPGSYPRFSTQVTAALRERAEVEVLDLADRGHLRGLGVRDELVRQRLLQALGEEGLRDEAFAEQVAGADALFVDWADRGAVVALMSVPEGTPVTLRIHSMDALSPWIHLLDWERVDDLVLVSDHLRDVVVRLLGGRLASTRLHVVPNAIDTARLPAGPKGDGALRTVLMIGWGQPVKDPVWALDVLSRLRREDPRWRLLLVGPDLDSGILRSGHDYLEQFRSRVGGHDVRGAVDIVGETDDLAPSLTASGFVLSSSRRESFGVGLVEGAASGAVPVVRNWPIFASLDGARRVFPPEWVVDTVEEAAARILRHAEPQTWARASAEVRAEVARRFLSRDPSTQLADVILGRTG